MDASAEKSNERLQSTRTLPSSPPSSRNSLVDLKANIAGPICPALAGARSAAFNPEKKLSGDGPRNHSAQYAIPRPTAGGTNGAAGNQRRQPARFDRSDDYRRDNGGNGNEGDRRQYVGGATTTAGTSTRPTKPEAQQRQQRPLSSALNDDRRRL